MTSIISILFWVGIAFGVDGSLALLFRGKWQKLVRGLDIQRIAFIEIGVGLVFLVAHFLLAKGM